MNQRHCGDCQLCCKLLPVHDNEPHPHRKEIHKKAGVRCEYQKVHKGCLIYNMRPFACREWNCRWLLNDDMANMGRPDRVHYVVDVSPDYITIKYGDNEPNEMLVVQIWVDPKYRNAWRDPELLAYLERRGKEGIAGLLRFSSTETLTVFAPTISSNKQWHEIAGESEGREHTLEELIEKCGSELVKPAVMSRRLRSQTQTKN